MSPPRSRKRPKAARDSKALAGRGDRDSNGVEGKVCGRAEQVPGEGAQDPMPSRVCVMGLDAAQENTTEHCSTGGGMCTEGRLWRSRRPLYVSRLVHAGAATSCAPVSRH